MEKKKRGRPPKPKQAKTGNKLPAESADNRKADGKFGPGNCANPGGRPKIPENIIEMCRAASPRAIQELIHVFEDEQARPGDKIRASEALLNRAWGTPVQSVEMSGNVGGGFMFAALSDEELEKFISDAE